MKRAALSFIIFASVLTSCREENSNKYLKLYPFFKNADEFKKDKTVSLNNFVSRNNKNGLEYFLSDSGKLLEIRQWKNNYLNGNIISYSRNNNVYLVGQYKNDTLCGDYFELDTNVAEIKLVSYKEKLKTNIGVIDNQVKNFTNGKLDTKSGIYYTVEREADSLYKIKLNGKINFPYLKMFITESNDNEYNFNRESLKMEIQSNDGISCNYKTLKNGKKFASGYLLNYRYPTKEEIKESGMDKNKLIGRITFLKFKLY